MNYIGKLTFFITALFLSHQVQSSLIEIEFITKADSANYDKYYSPSTLTTPFESTITFAFNTDNRSDMLFSWGESARFNNLIGESPMSDLMNVAYYDQYDPLNSAFDIRQGYPLWPFPNPLDLDETDNPIMSFFSWMASRNVPLSSYYSHNIYLHGPLIAAVKDSIFKFNALDYLLKVNKNNLAFDFSVDRYLRTGSTRSTGGYVSGTAIINDIKVDGISVTTVPEPQTIWLYFLAIAFLRGSTFRKSFIT